MSNNDREIERKYLLRELPSRVARAPSLEIDQGYLPGERINERVRRTRGNDGVRYYRTFKTGSGIERVEIEEETSELFFTTVWPLTRGCRVRKRRYLSRTTGRREVDVFDRDGLWLAEIELERVDRSCAAGCARSSCARYRRAAPQPRARPVRAFPVAYAFTAPNGARPLHPDGACEHSLGVGVRLLEPSDASLSALKRA